MAKMWSTFATQHRNTRSWTMQLRSGAGNLHTLKVICIHSIQNQWRKLHHQKKRTALIIIIIETRTLQPVAKINTNLCRAPPKRLYEKWNTLGILLDSRALMLSLVSDRDHDCVSIDKAYVL